MATGAALMKSKLVEHSDAEVQKWARSPKPGFLPPLMATPQHTVRNPPTTDEVFLKAVLSADISERCAAAGRVMMDAIDALTDPFLLPRMRQARPLRFQLYSHGITFSHRRPWTASRSRLVAPRRHPLHKRS